MPKKRKSDLPAGVYAKGRRFYYYLRVPDPDLPGKTKQVWSHGYDTPEEAEIGRREAELRRARGERVKTSTLLLRDYLPMWLASKRDVKATTRHGYQQVLDNYLLPHLGDKALGRLTPEDIDLMIDHLLTVGGAQLRPLAVRTVRMAYVVLNDALNDAVKRRHITFNPADAVTPPKRKSNAVEPIRYWTREEVHAFYAAAGDHWIVPLVKFAIHTGMRRGELVGLRWSDLGPDYAAINVQATRTPVGREVVTGTPKSGKSRQFALGASAREELRAIRARQTAWRLAAGEAWQNAEPDLVFTNEIGQALLPWWVSNGFRRLVASLDVRPIRFHDLRHTNATLALSAGVRPDIVSQRLGHASVAFTIDVYSHVIPKDDAEAADAIDRAVN